MNPKLTDVEVLLDKINRLFRNFRNEDPKVNRIELELFKDYTRQLYDKLWEYELHKATTNGNVVNGSGDPEIKKIDTSIKKEETPLFYKTEEPVTTKKPEPEKREIRTFEEPVVQNSYEAVEKKEITPEVDVRKFEDSKKKSTPEIKSRKSLALHDEAEEESMTRMSQKLQTEKVTLADKIGGKRVHDLRSAIDLNDKFYFIRELFKGDHNAFDKAIRYINSLTSFDDAKFFIQKDLATDYNWSDSDSVGKLLEVVKVKFV